MNKASIKNAIAVSVFCGLAAMVTAPFAQAYEFTRDLQIGMYGEDVRQLQILLNSYPDTQIATDGPGAPGQETTYFGAKTEAAFEKFLEKASAQLSNQVSMMTEDEGTIPSELTEESDLTSGTLTSSSSNCVATTSLAVGDTFVTKGEPWSIRRGAGNSYGFYTVKQNPGVNATVVEGPIMKDGFRWFKVNYATGTDGWNIRTVLYDHMVTIPVHTVCTPKTSTSTPVTTTHSGGWGTASSSGSSDHDRPTPPVSRPRTPETTQTVPATVDTGVDHSRPTGAKPVPQSVLNGKPAAPKSTSGAGQPVAGYTPMNHNVVSAKAAVMNIMSTIVSKVTSVVSQGSAHHDAQISGPAGSPSKSSTGSTGSTGAKTTTTSSASKTTTTSSASKSSTGPAGGPTPSSASKPSTTSGGHLNGSAGR
jgi:hypothetical protein